MRVYELARELKLTSKELLDHLKKMGIQVKSHSSALPPEQVGRVRKKLSPSPPATKETSALALSPEAETAPALPQPEEPSREVKREEGAKPSLVVKFPITVRQLADQLGQKPNILIKKLLENDMFVSLNQFLDEDTATLVAHEYGYDLIPYVPHREKLVIQPVVEKEVSPREVGENLLPRPPVVTLMGHIDHGKTTLLDSIRHSRITAKEAGGITQHIGAYRVETSHGSVVFLDTPGHEAFTTMRARGAQLTDIVVLVVAADDGVMPQTLEAIDHARAAGVPMVVAINKIDKVASNPDKVRRQLAEQNLVPESLGGETLCTEVSATTKEGLDNFLEMILLQAEIMELKANPEGPARGTVVEARLTPDRGTVTTLLVKSGTLKKGANVVCGPCAGRIKMMFDDRGKAVSAASPSMPVEVLGIIGVPPAGSAFRVVESEVEAREITARLCAEVQEKSWEESKRVTLEDFFQRITEGKIRELRLILKGDVQGSVEALSSLLIRLSTKEVVLKIIHEGVGAISESDVMLASASKAVIIGFHVKADSKIRQIAKVEGVDIRSYDVIYDAVEEVRKALEGLLPPKVEERSLGEARVLQLFRISKLGIVAGSEVEKGKLRRGDQIRLWREGQEIARDKVTTLKRFQDSVEEVTAGQECGIGLGNFHDFKVGDVLESYEIIKIPQKL